MKKLKYIIGIVIIVACIVFLAIRSFKKTGVYYLTVSEVYKSSSLGAKSFRVDGNIVPGSIIWNLLLMFLVFELCILGTFITRTNILSSVHSFAESNIGIYLFSFIIITSIIYLSFLLFRWKALSLISKSVSVKECFSS